MIGTPKLPKQLIEVGPVIGRPTSRVEGPAKVTGHARYAAEFNVPGLCYGYVVGSSIAAGKIVRIDSTEALALPGVLTVFTHENQPKTAWLDRHWQDDIAPSGSPRRYLHGTNISYSMEPVALVVAETFETARLGARLVKVEYEAAEHHTDLRAELAHARPPAGGASGFIPPPKPRGHPDEAFDAAPVKVEVAYAQPTETHNPMEMFATTVVYEGDDTLTIYDKVQGCQNSHKYVTGVFGLKAGQVRVKNPFVGGGFGSGLRPQYQLYMAAMAALELKRSVRVVLTRPEMFSIGHRPANVQQVKMACDANGKLQAIIHESVGETSTFEDYAETVVNWSAQAYHCDNVRVGYQVVALNEYTPQSMRAPGAVTGVYALECAVDELAAAARIDPVEFRVINFSPVDQMEGKPFSSKQVRECYRQGAERFGWSKRNPTPRSMRDGRYRVGYGMAGGVWDAMQGQAEAKAVLSVDGTLVVSSATADIGTGTYTVMTMIAADTMGLPVDRVTFRLGDSTMPMSPVEGGSWTVTSVGSAVKAACDTIGQQLFKMAADLKGSPLAKASLEDVKFEGGFIHLRADPDRRVSFTDAMRAAGVYSLQETARSVPNLVKQGKYTRSSHGACFVEVRVDEEMGTVGVRRVVSAVAAGRIINPKAAASQVSGAVVMGIGMALHEETLRDHVLGRPMNHDFAEYHVPVNADIGGEIDVIFVEEHDDIVSPLGAKGVGEIGIVGVASAIANAVYHATGKRVRDLPITIDKMIQA